ncbi:MAG: hypothetical protein AB7J30_20140, partial [Hyphomicrobium sp.]|uniref:hypothetical protein n=1 Tax=Hyphomicrobium sp. TaxID=82 RepID=UPI003D0A0310
RTRFRESNRRTPRPMFPAIAIASNALAVQGQKLEAIASEVAAGASTSGTDMRKTDTSLVRIGALPIGGAAESLASLKEVELAYRMNLAVIATASEMVDSLLDAVQPDDRR